MVVLSRQWRVPTLVKVCVNLKAKGGYFEHKLARLCLINIAGLQLLYISNDALNYIYAY